MKTFRFLLGILSLLLAVAIAVLFGIEYFRYSNTNNEIFLLIIPLIFIGILLVHNRRNTSFFTEKKSLKIFLTLLLIVLSFILQGKFQAMSCVSKRCDYTVGFPFPMTIATDTSTGLAGLLIFALGTLMNYAFYYLLLSLVIRLFRKKSSILQGSE